jgi:hypothetical protein
MDAFGIATVVALLVMVVASAIHLLSLPERAASKEAFEHAQPDGTTNLEATPALNRFAGVCAPRVDGGNDIVRQSRPMSRQKWLSLAQ